MKLWGGRFGTAAGQASQQFTASIEFDQRLYGEDIEGSKAHALMLAKQGIIEGEVARDIINALDDLREEIERGEVTWRVEDEDIHMNIERLLLRKLGSAAGKLHTARSRNDQVALDTRLYLRRRLDQLSERLSALQSALLKQADQHICTVMPGYTHMQVAQPVSLAHHLLAYFEMLERDYQRLQDCRRRINVSPLGACALGGTSFDIDPQQVASALGFSGTFANSMDAVADRDFVIEFLSAASLIMVHLSRLAEEIVVWSSQQFAFVQLDEAFAGGSSIMPQKKNPDSLELIRGKTGRVVGHLMAMLMVLKGLPLAYNSDMQEDKEALFDAGDTLEQCLVVAAQVVAGLQFQVARMAQAAEQGHATATELADFLTRKGMPFREAHSLVGRLVRSADEQGLSLAQLSLEELMTASPWLDEEARSLLTPMGAMHRKTSPGGTAPVRVREAIAQGQRILDQRRLPQPAD